jgi:hypothetical protein
MRFGGGVVAPLCRRFDGSAWGGEGGETCGFFPSFEEGLASSCFLVSCRRFECKAGEVSTCWVGGSFA